MADFFDKVKGGFNKGIATVSTGSKTLLEKNKINTVIKTLEDEKKQLAEIMGNKVYKYCCEHKGADIPLSEVANFCREISNRNVQIQEQKKKIVELDNEMNQVRGVNPESSGNEAKCVCGHVNSSEAKFCASCGASLK